MKTLFLLLILSFSSLIAASFTVEFKYPLVIETSFDLASTLKSVLEKNDKPLYDHIQSSSLNKKNSALLVSSILAFKQKNIHRPHQAFLGSGLSRAPPT
ncbi:MAG: hypothetical protein CME66_03480 [Halobacteriovoraceae bacterium]|nr:hypothetical protein [Halobacteriovoraceae bacterium]|tara:strand:+ start:156 stop:452 length:297 start_codon:yes stop_codon:yes gene_type:complete